METQKQTKYFLALEYRHGDFMTIDINVLTNNPFPIDYSKLQNIDSFTKNYEINEIIELVKTSNLVPIKYLFGRLFIVKDNKASLDVLSKDSIYSLPSFLEENINNKQNMNKLMNIYLKYDRENFMSLKQAINDRNIPEITEIISKLPYEQIRSVYMYIHDNIMTSEKIKVLENVS